MFRNLIFIPLFIILLNSAKAQDTAVYTKYYYENGVLSSEGTLRNGKPDGYWKTYNDKGILISEGNRRNFELDSLWKFYNENGKLSMEINYQKGKKNGIRRSYSDKETIEENFVNDTKQGISKYFYLNGKLKLIIPFDNGLEHGVSKEFDDDSTIISFTEYKRGMVINRERINRKDKNGLKQGYWKTFWQNDKCKTEGYYINNKKNGFFKTFSEEGNLLTIEKYINDELQTDVPELRKLEVRTDYYPDGKIKTVGSYNNGIAEGVRREYNREGKIEISYIMSKGKIIGKGIVDENGFKQGAWIEYYENGAKKAEGKYKDNKKIAYWKFYYKNGQLEQEGLFNANGNSEGEWKWYFENGNDLLINNFQDGLEDGPMIEYDDTGKVITKGEFIEGQETGEWYYNINNYVSKGKYVDGKRTEMWKDYFPNGKPAFTGAYIEDNPNGKHTYYWESGKLKEEGNFIMGMREGEWRKYDENGILFVRTYYRNGREIRYDNSPLDPKIEEDDQ